MLKYILLLFIFCLAIKLQSLGQLSIDTAELRNELYHHISALAHDSMRGRLSGSKENANAAAYIKQQFKSYGLKNIEGVENYGIPVAINGVYYGENVMGAILGLDSSKKDSVIIMSAHYDHIGTIYNGANDNASGSSALLAMAKLFAHAGANNYTLIFIAFTGEEQGMKGSWYMQPFFKKVAIKQVVNLEMLGRSNEFGLRPFIVGENSFTFIKQSNKILHQAGLGFGKRFFMNDPYPTQLLLERSDHWPFVTNKTKAVTILLSSPNDVHYHKPSDDLSSLNMNDMTTVTYAIAIVMQQIMR